MAVCSWGSGRGILCRISSSRRSSSPMFSQLKSRFSWTSRSSLSWQESTVSPRFEHSALMSLEDRPSHLLTSSRLVRHCSRSRPPNTPRRPHSACSSSNDHFFHRFSSGSSSSAAFCASADFASAMMNSNRPLRNSESCSARPSSVRSAILRQDPLCESRTISFFKSQTVASLRMDTSRSSCVMACRSVTCNGCTPSSSASGCCSACASKTLRTDGCCAASSNAESPPAPQRRISAPRSNRI
mmetsp:Transcript_48216/g.136206  ORF Transcript_48216/g.136206 Transcript_48216/m.136206 type:complete len:242 (-) Transcript_48216:470-1195(-)